MSNIIIIWIYWSSQRGRRVPCPFIHLYHYKKIALFGLYNIYNMHYRIEKDEWKVLLFEESFIRPFSIRKYPLAILILSFLSFQLWPNFRYPLVWLKTLDTLKIF